MRFLIGGRRTTLSAGRQKLNQRCPLNTSRDFDRTGFISARRSLRSPPSQLCSGGRSIRRRVHGPNDQILHGVTSQFLLFFHWIQELVPHQASWIVPIQDSFRLRMDPLCKLDFRAASCNYLSLRGQQRGPAGVYWFVLLENHGDRQIVRILSSDRSTIYATLCAVPTRRTQSTASAVSRGNFASRKLPRSRLLASDAIGRETLCEAAVPVLLRSTSQLSMVDAWVYNSTDRFTIFAIFGQRWLARSPLQTTKRR